MKNLTTHLPNYTQIFKTKARAIDMRIIFHINDTLNDS